MPRSWLRTAGEHGVLLGVACLAAYAALAPSYLVDGDNAEIRDARRGSAACRIRPAIRSTRCTCARCRGCRGTPAHAAALATALLGAAAIVVLHAACRAWGARPAAATLACAMVAAAPVVLRVHTEAEVFALNDLLAATICCGSPRRGPLRGGRASPRSGSSPGWASRTT